MRRDMHHSMIAGEVGGGEGVEGVVVHGQPEGEKVKGMSLEGESQRTGEDSPLHQTVAGSSAEAGMAGKAGDGQEQGGKCGFKD